MPEQYKYLSLKDTMGAADRDNAMMENYRINQDAAKFNQGVAREDRATSENMRMLQIGAGATKYMLDNPDSVPSVIPKLTEAGILPPDYDWQQEDPDELMAEIQEANHQFMAQLGGGQQEADAGTSAMQEYQFAVSQGYKGSFEEWKAQNKGGVNIQMPKQYPPPAAGWMYEYGPDGNVTGQKPIPGGPAARDIEAGEVADIQAQYNQQQRSALMTDEITRTFELIGPESSTMGETGPAGKVVSSIPIFGASTGAGRVRQLVGTLQGQIAVDELQKMRAASKTGGALGAISERELTMLSNLQGALDPDGDDFVLAYNLARLQNGINDVIHGPGNGVRMTAPESAYEQLYRNPMGIDRATLNERFKRKYGYLPPGFEVKTEAF